MKPLLLSIVFVMTFFGIFTLTSIPIFAQSTSGMTDMGGVRTMKSTKNMSQITRFMEVDNDNLFTPLDVLLDIVSVIIMIVAIFIISKSVHEYGKSTVGVAILYFLTATLILGAIRFIFILDDDNILNVTDVAEMVAWHTLFFYSMFLFYIAGQTFTKLVSTEKGKSSYPRALFMLIFSVLLSAIILVFYSQPFVQNFWVKYLQNTWFEQFGGFHIVAVIFSLIIAFYLNTVKNKFKGYSGALGSIIVAILLLGSIHLWELLNESWRIVVVSDDFGEFIERVLWIPVFAFILYSYIRLRRISNVDSNTQQVSATATIPSVSAGIQPTPLSQTSQPISINTSSIQVPSQQVLLSEEKTKETPSIFSANKDIGAIPTGTDENGKNGI